MSTSIEELSTHFKAASNLKSSPIYSVLCNFISTQPEILQTMINIPLQKSPRTILLAAIHSLLMTGTPHRLANFYPSLNGKTKLTNQNQSILCTDFLDFFRKYKNKIEPLLLNNTQTNEARRCAALLPAFSELVKREKQNHFSLIEIGTSAGFLLNADQYAFDLNGFHLGNTNQTQPILTQWKGKLPENLQQNFIKIDHKIGIDLNPLDIEDDTVKTWLKALIWPEQVERLKIFDMACNELTKNKKNIIFFKGYFENYINHVLSICADSKILCFLSVWVLYQFSTEEKNRLNDQLSMIAKTSNKKIYFILDDWEIDKMTDANNIILREYDPEGNYHDTKLCQAQHHGEWVTHYKSSIL